VTDSASHLSVVIPTKDRPQLLARCLDTVRAALRPGDEVVVVDASSSAHDVAAVVAERGARLVRCSPPGSSRQRNAGAAEARHDLIAFLDDDVRVATGWADGVVEAFVEHPEVAFLTGRLEVPPDQTGYTRAVSVKTETEPALLTGASRGTLGHSANIALRRAAFERVGGFDEQLGPGAPFPAAEDGDLMDRLFAAGYLGWYAPAALGWHDQWRTRLDLVKLEWSYSLGMAARLRKLSRSDRSRAKALATDYLWRNALQQLPSLARQRNEFGVVFVLSRLAGTAVGWVRAVFVHRGKLRTCR